MEAKLITIIEYCNSSTIEIEFISLLKEEGLIEIHLVSGQEFLPLDQLPLIERYARWYYEMEINLAGIDALHHLVAKVQRLKTEIDELQNRLRLYE